MTVAELQKELTLWPALAEVKVSMPRGPFMLLAEVVRLETVKRRAGKDSQATEITLVGSDPLLMWS